MYTNTTFISKKQAEQINDPSDTRILISVRAPLHESYAWYRHPILHQGAWKDILPVEFHDVDPAGKSGMSMKDHATFKYVFFNENHVQQIFDFLYKYQSTEVDTVIVHCDAGISRSAAIAKFIASVYSLYYPETYSVYNRHVFTTLMSSYQRVCYGTDNADFSKFPGYFNGE